VTIKTTRDTTTTRFVYLAGRSASRDETLGFHRDAAKRRHRSLDFALSKKADALIG